MISYMSTPVDWPLHQVAGGLKGAVTGGEGVGRGGGDGRPHYQVKNLSSQLTHCKLTRKLANRGLPKNVARVTKKNRGLPLQIARVTQKSGEVYPKKVVRVTQNLFNIVSLEAAPPGRCLTLK